MKRPAKTLAPAPAKGRWVIMPTPAAMKLQQGLSDHLPIPGREQQRVERGKVTFEEIDRWIARFLEENPDHERIDEFRRVSEQFSNQAKVSQAINEGRFTDARDLLRQMVEANPKDMRARYNLANVSVDLRDGETAMNLLIEVRPVFGRDVRFPISWARSLALLGREKEMLAFLHRARKENPENAAVTSELQRLGELIPVSFSPGNLRATQYVTKTQFAEQAREKVLREVAAGNIEGTLRYVRYVVANKMVALAMELAGEVRRAAPKDRDARLLEAEIHTRQGELDKAEGLINTLSQEEPENPKYVMELGRLAAMRNDRPRAEELYRRALRMDTNLISAAEQLVLIQPSAEEKTNCARALVEEFPGSWVPPKLMGDLLFNSGDIEGALAKHRESYTIRQNDDALTMILHELGHLGRTEEAIELIERTPDIHRRSARVRWNAANLHLEGGRVRPAVKLLTTLVNDPLLPYETRHSASALLADINANVRGRH
ncbi:tetratricopeptide repeat protein [Candidatus Poribacteria bacterium]|nr:tetratricopeptide repeat protein [Candidatus Poribacteria bacterium]